MKMPTMKLRVTAISTLNWLHIEKSHGPELPLSEPTSSIAVKFSLQKSFSELSRLTASPTIKATTGNVPEERKERGERSEEMAKARQHQKREQEKDSTEKESESSNYRTQRRSEGVHSFSCCYSDLTSKHVLMYCLSPHQRKCVLRFQKWSIPEREPGMYKVQLREEPMQAERNRCLGKNIEKTLSLTIRV